MKDIDRFQRELERPLDGAAGTVTERDLEDDAASFLAFASAMGVAPPSPSASETAV